MNKEQFLKADISQISQVYLGKDGCRCGCGGDYVSTSYMKNNRSETNDKLAERRLKKAKKLIEEGAEFTEGDTYLDIVVKEGETDAQRRVMCFYFDELK